MYGTKPFAVELGAPLGSQTSKAATGLTVPVPLLKGVSLAPVNALITPPAVGSAQQPVAGLESTCTNVVAESTPESYGCAESERERQ